MLSARKSRPKLSSDQVNLERRGLLLSCRADRWNDPGPKRRARASDDRSPAVNQDRSHPEQGCSGALWVRDEGHVPADVRAIAFERFARGPDASDRRGAGLGLALVKAIAEQHGGDAALEDLNGAGVRAVVWILAR